MHLNNKAELHKLLIARNYTDKQINLKCIDSCVLFFGLHV